MTEPRRVPLVGGEGAARSWNEQMGPGEYAVHYSSFEELGGAGPYCTIFGDLGAAVVHAEERVAAQPVLRCRIYGDQGWVGAPVREVQGTKFKGDSGLSRGFRRGVGSALFFGGLLLICVDWTQDFRLSWPAMAGSRMLVPGLILLSTEVLIVLHARLQRRKALDGGAS